MSDLTRRTFFKWLFGLAGASLLPRLPDLSAETEATPAWASVSQTDWTRSDLPKPTIITIKVEGAGKVSTRLEEIKAQINNDIGEAMQRSIRDL